MARQFVVTVVAAVAVLLAHPLFAQTNGLYLSSEKVFNRPEGRPALLDALDLMPARPPAPRRERTYVCAFCPESMNREFVRNFDGMAIPEPRPADPLEAPLAEWMSEDRRRNSGRNEAERCARTGEVCHESID